MRKVKPFLFLIGLWTTPIWSTTYYVSTAVTSKDSADGRTELSAWRTIKYAASKAVAGDIVYIKAGDYGAENVNFTKSGSAGNPITFVGYKNIPGEIVPALVNSPNPLAAFNVSEMPTINGGNRAAGVGFTCQNQKYLVIKNFQIQNYAYGLVAGGITQDAGNLVLNNINVMSIGSVSDSYSGEGILLGSMGTRYSHNDTLINCLVVNAAAEGIGINGNNNVLRGCKVYCNENTQNAATDYYIIVTGSYNTLTDCMIERAPGLAHNGHGIGAKTNAEQVIDQHLNVPAIPAQYNKFINCTAHNMGESFYVRHRTAQYNLFYHCKAMGTHTGDSASGSGEGNLIVIRDGASDNTFDGCTAENCNSAFEFVDTIEDGDSTSTPIGHPGNNNKILNCLAINCYLGVNFSDYGVPSDAGDNLIAHCTFYKTRYMHYVGRHATKMKYVGNIYFGCVVPPATTGPGGYFKGFKFPDDILPNGTDTYFKQCNFINIQGGVPAGFVSSSVGSIALAPAFVDPKTLNFHLKSGSEGIDKVDLLPIDVNPKDFDGMARYNGGKSDMGAFEYYTGTALFYPTLREKKFLSVAVQYPSVFFKINSPASGSLEVFDIVGKKLSNISQAIGNKTMALNIRDFSNGEYIVQLKVNGEIYTERFTLKR